MRPPSFEILTCGVAASEGATERHAALAACDENSAALCGVSHGDNTELTVRPPDTVATVVSFQFGPRVVGAGTRNSDESVFG